MQHVEAQHVVQATQHALDDLNEFSAHHLRLRLGKHLSPKNGTVVFRDGVYVPCGPSNASCYSDDDDVALTVYLTPQEGISMANAELESYSTILKVSYPASQVPSTSSSSSVLANFVASNLQDLFSEEQAIIASILTSNQSPGYSQMSNPSLGQTTSSQSTSTYSREQRQGMKRALAPELAAKMARRKTRALKYAPTYHITISLFTSTACPSAWEIESAVDEYLTPLLESFSGISNFTVDTQVQLYASFSPSVHQPEYDSDIAAWTLRKEDLSGFINAAEWPLSPSIGAGPTLNFILFVPDDSMAPLAVKDSHATSWLIPQWGGVTILNPSGSDVEKSQSSQGLTKEAIRPALLTFSHQLLSLLGTPQTPASLPFQLQTLTRVQTASLLLSASSTMGSLARLTVALPSIAIPESVAVAVDRTLSNLHTTCSDLRNGEFPSALHHARIAEFEAEKGFFEKSMVGQVYFPDEHKVAVYLPLLGPVGVPLVMSALKEIRRLLSHWKARHSGH